MGISAPPLSVDPHRRPRISRMGTGVAGDGLKNAVETRRLNPDVFGV
jgi:hypothetical protein